MHLELKRRCDTHSCGLNCRFVINAQLNSIGRRNDVKMSDSRIGKPLELSCSFT